MPKTLSITFDSDLLEEIAASFDLREPNKQALRKLIFTLDGDYNPSIMQVLSLATGVGKTYLMAAFVEYLRRQGVGNVMIITPGKTVQRKTINNFNPASSGYIKGAQIPTQVVTPQDYSAYQAKLNTNSSTENPLFAPMLAFIFNIQQLIAPKQLEGNTQGGTQEAARRRPRKFDESTGVLFQYLKELTDLVVIADESHLYGPSAVAFNAAIKELAPAATIGLTASPSANDNVIYTYPLYQAIADCYIKSPVLAFRKNGYGATKESEEQQLRDALHLRTIKQEYYDFYSRQHKRPHLPAVLFVVCQDTEHATDVASLLRSTEYFGKDEAVLQVDSKHEDDETQLRLEQLDQEDSPVLAVVSVNKLKEGWDVKNIAVIVTLRAMASEVLTQQTMGRGLRLPFGKYTGILQIDQLDIISHQSFKDLLAAENILEQFGLEDAVKHSNRNVFEHTVKTVVSQQFKTSESDSDGMSPTTSASIGNDDYEPTDLAAPIWVATADEKPRTDYSPQLDNTPLASGIGFRAISEDTTSNLGKMDYVTVHRDSKFADISYKFPSTIVTVYEPRIDLANLDSREIQRAAHKVTSSGDILIRKEIIIAVGNKIKTRDTESAEVESQRVSESDVKEALVKRIISNRSLDRTEENTILIRDYVVTKFMEAAPIEYWTLKSLQSADNELSTLIRNFIKMTLSQRREETEIVAIQMPQEDLFTLPMNTPIHDQIESSEDFKKNEYYGGWIKSLFEAESFDSYSGEYVLAKLLNSSPHIVWWHRIHRSRNIRIAYTPRNNYTPDFVAFDDQGVHWIIEGKDTRGRHDDTVQAKRRAAETVVHRLLAHPDFRGQKWGYLIAYEDDTATAESWDDLKAKAQPVTN